MTRHNGEQDIYLQIGRSGCYFLVLVRIAQNFVIKRIGKNYNIDIADVYRTCLAKGFIKENCYVNNPTEILRLVSGEKWYLEKSNSKNDIKIFADKDYYDSVLVVLNNQGNNHFTHKDYEPLKQRFNNEVISYRHIYIYRQTKGGGAKTTYDVQTNNKQ